MACADHSAVSEQLIVAFHDHVLTRGCYFALTLIPATLYAFPAIILLFSMRHLCVFDSHFDPDRVSGHSVFTICIRQAESEHKHILTNLH